MKQESDWELVQRCRQGEGVAWNALVGRYERLVYYVVRQYGLVGEDAADIVQQTFTTMLESLHVFHQDSNLKSWLGTVAKRHAWRYLKRYDQEQVHIDSDLNESLIMTAQITADDSSWEIAQWLTDGLSQMNEKCRNLLYALYLEDGGLPYDTVVTKLGISRGSIGPTRARCLAKLKQIMEDEM